MTSSLFYHILYLRYCCIKDKVKYPAASIALGSLLRGKYTIETRGNMKNKILCTILAISLTLATGINLPINAKQAEAMDTLSGTLTSVSPYTSSTYTHAEVFQNMKVYHGIDVSYHNGNINWDNVAADGVEYAFIRAGYRGYGNGSLQQDSKFTTYAPAAIAAGIPVGVYYFTEAVNETEAIEEAEDCIRMIQENNIDVTLPIALDYEYQYNAAGQNASRKKNLSVTAATTNCIAFCKTIADAGYTPIIYANSNDLVKLIDGAILAENYGIWLANYTTKTKYTGSYQIWQYSSKGSVDGISGNVDCNFWYTENELSINTNPKNKVTKNISNATVASIPAQTYTGKALTPALSITYGSKTLKLNKDYTLAYKNNINPGKATVTITGMGTYTDTLSKSFKISPAAVTNLSATTTSSKVTLEWNGKTAYTGYEIYRKKTYDGTYTKVKTITNAKETKWVNKNLTKEREYFYKVRAYAKVNDTMYYGPFTSLSAAAISGTKAALNTKGCTILKKPSAKAKVLVSAPYNATIRYLGKTVLEDKSKFYHVQYKKGGKLYDGYLKSIKGLKFKKALTTTAKVKLRVGAGTHTKALTTVPKKQTIVILGQKKSGGLIWYKTTYLKGKKAYTGYVSGDYLE